MENCQRTERLAVVMSPTDQILDPDITAKIQSFWREKPIATGIALIDLQHIWLIYIIFKLESILESENHSSIQDSLNQAFLDVLEYAGEHFSLEEDIMREFSYPNLENHVKSHRDFAERLKDKFENFGNDEVVAHGLLSVLKKWLFNHILVDDKDYSNYFQSMGDKIKEYSANILKSKKYPINRFQVNLYNEILKKTESEIQETESDDPTIQVRNIWKSYNLAIHVPLVDLQHIWLLKMIMDLDKAVKSQSGNRSEVLKNVIAGAIKYTEEHFEVEEKLMKQFRFPDLINHFNQHKRFVTFVKKRADEMELGDPLAGEHLVMDLKNWLLSHIAFEDRKIGIILKDKINEVSEFTKKIHQNGDLIIRPEQKTLYKEVMKN